MHIAIKAHWRRYTYQKSHRNALRSNMLMTYYALLKRVDSKMRSLTSIVNGSRLIKMNIIVTIAKTTGVPLCKQNFSEFLLILAFICSWFNLQLWNNFLVLRFTGQCRSLLSLTIEPRILYNRIRQFLGYCCYLEENQKYFVWKITNKLLFKNKKA